MNSRKELSLLRPCKALKACTKRNSIKEDRISELPDDIIFLILSFLTMKEAGRTSMLSKRWRHLWAYIPCLNFDSYEEITKWKKQERRYVRWVDKVVSSHKAPTIDEFRVRFHLAENRKDNVDSWLRFAAEKRVKRLQLENSPTPCINRISYTFPSLSFNSLTSLQLVNVEVTGEALEKLLYDCQTLECVSVALSDSLVRLKVSPESSVNLKSLSIISCFETPNLEIDAPNLVSFKYTGGKICSPLKRTPRLAELYIGGRYGSHLMDTFSDVSSLISQIEVLTIETCSFVRRVAKVFPVFTKLKILNVSIHPQSGKELFGIRSLITACPLLQKLSFENSNGEEVKMTKEMRKIEAQPHHNLKHVEIVAFQDYESDFEFVKYLIKIAVALETIVIEPTEIATPWGTPDELRTRATNQAMKLYSCLRPGTELEIRQVPMREITWY